MSALPPAAALAHAARLLEGHGFAVVARNARGDSLYLRQAGCAWALRLSNHARTEKQRRRRADVLASLVVRQPRTPDQVAAMVAAAIRDFTAARARALSDEVDAGSSKESATRQRLGAVPDPTGSGTALPARLKPRARHRESRARPGL